MAFPIPPQTFSCKACDWTKTTPRPVGDARVRGYDSFSHCPRCGKAVEARNATVLELMLARLGEAAGKLR